LRAHAGGHALRQTDASGTGKSQMEWRVDTRVDADTVAYTLRENGKVIARNAVAKEE